jgi:hypothetical protein
MENRKLIVELFGIIAAIGTTLTLILIALDQSNYPLAATWLIS